MKKRPTIKAKETYYHPMISKDVARPADRPAFILHEKEKKIYL
jgi:hypothetical protein